MTRTHEIDGVQVLVDGDGPATMLMLHGWPDTAALWDAQVAAFAPTMRCVRFTLPGFAIERPRRAMSLAAMNAFIVRVLDAVCPGQPVVLMVHDWGCVYGYHFAMTHPERVGRLIGVDIGDAGSAAFRKALTAKVAMMIAAYQLWLALAWRLGGRIGDGMTRRMARWLRAPGDPATIGSAMCYPYDIAWTGSHGGFRRAAPLDPRCPMLFVYGERKPFMFHTPGWAQALAARPGCRVVGLRTGHWVMHQQPEAFNRAVLDWCAGDAGAGAGAGDRAA
jgi:pimeloyl-ACP methyl ester carboxylesterase